MTRINSAIEPKRLTDEHLIAEHRELKRMPYYLYTNRGYYWVPKEFCLGPGHISFFLDKFQFTYNRYQQVYKECKRRGFKVTDYSKNWDLIMTLDIYDYNRKDHIPTPKERELLVERISERIMNSRKECFHYNHEQISKEKAIELLKQ